MICRMIITAWAIHLGLRRSLRPHCAEDKACREKSTLIIFAGFSQTVLWDFDLKTWDEKIQITRCYFSWELFSWLYRKTNPFPLSSSSKFSQSLRSPSQHGNRMSQSCPPMPEQMFKNTSEINSPIFPNTDSNHFKTIN